MSKISSLNTSLNPLRNLRNADDTQPLIGNSQVNSNFSLGKDISNFFTTTKDIPYSNFINAGQQPGTSRTPDNPRDGMSRNPALAAGGAAESKAAQQAAGSSNSSQATGKAIKSFTDLSSAIVSGITEKWNTHQRGGFQEQFFNERQGSAGFGMHTNLHADMRYVARNQTQQEREHIQRFGMGVGGPIGGLAAYFISKNHVSGMEKELDLKTARDDQGNKVDPQGQQGIDYRDLNKPVDGKSAVEALASPKETSTNTTQDIEMQDMNKDTQSVNLPDMNTTETTI